MGTTETATMVARTDDERWAIVRKRERSASGSFVYAVRTTGVYCRPGCSSRMPNRENVVFFDTPRGAEAEGYRACMRCAPAAARPIDPHAVAVERACRLIESSRRPPAVDRVARAVGLSTSHFHRVFKRLVGVTPRAYAAEHRRSDAGDGPGAMHVAVVRCHLGSVLVAATPRGVRAIDLGDDPETLVGDFRARHPGAEIDGGDEPFRALVRRVVAHVDEPSGCVDLPLDIRGTAFQRRVWEALRALAAGETTTYSALAEAIGRPTATRAVAQACAANPLAVVIPCHRVLRRDGGLAGYRWGAQRKRTLLDREARSTT